MKRAAAAEPITSFRGKYRFLSNFYPSPILYAGFTCPTVEHAYQAAKTLKLEERQWILAASEPGEAKKRGHQIVQRPGWNANKVFFMEMFLMQKFEIPELAQMLLSTGDAHLIEGNTWGDKFFGQINVAGEWIGENHLGLLLMKIRGALRG